MKRQGWMTLAGARHWPVSGAVGAALLLGAVSVRAQMPRLALLAVALGAVAFVVLLRLGRERALAVLIVGAGFFSAAPVAIGKLNISDVFLITAGGFVLLHAGDRQPLAAVPRGVLVGLGLVVAGGLFGSIFDPGLAKAFPHAILPLLSRLLGLPPRYGETIRFAWGTIGVVLLVRACALTRRQAETVLVAYGLGAALSTGWALVGPTSHGVRATGLTTHPVFLGSISAVAAVIGIGLFLAPRRALKIAGVVTVASGVVGIALSGTRSGVLILLAGVVILQLGMRSARRSALFLLIGVLAVGAALAGAGADTPVGTRLVGGGGAQQSTVARDLLRQDTFAVVRAHGLTGIGIQYMFEPHSLVPGILAVAGVLGLAGLLIVVASLVRSLVAVGRDDTMALAVLAAVLGVYACAWVVNLGWDRALWVPLALALSSLRAPTAPAARKDEGAFSAGHRPALPVGPP